MASMALDICISVGLDKKKYSSIIEGSFLFGRGGLFDSLKNPVWFFFRRMEYRRVDSEGTVRLTDDAGIKHRRKKT